MGMSGKQAVAAVAFLVACSPAWAGNGYWSMAKELSKGARQAGLKRVAVLPFVPADGGAPAGGWNISEKLTTQVVNAGRVQVVERSLLKKLLEEQDLGRTGALAQPLLKRLGQVFAVDGVVTGSFVDAGGDVVVQARLIDVETGVILAASESRIPRDWPDGPQPAPAPLPAAAAPAPSAPPAPAEPPSLDALTASAELAGEETCVDAAEKVDALNRQIEDVKARYWALQLKKGVSISGVRHNPGAEITDPALKREFYDRLRAWYVQEHIPPLTSEEVKRFVDIDGKASMLYGECGNTPWFVAKR